MFVSVACDPMCNASCVVAGNGKCDGPCRTGFGLTANNTCARECLLSYGAIIMLFCGGDVLDDRILFSRISADTPFTINSSWIPACGPMITQMHISCIFYGENNQVIYLTSFDEPFLAKNSKSA